MTEGLTETNNALMAPEDAHRPPADDDVPTQRATLGTRAYRAVRSILGSIRLRLVWWFIVVLAIATIASVLLVRQVLLQRLDARIDAELTQEVDEVRRLASGNDPDTGTPFGNDIRRIFEVFLGRNIPARYEAYLTYVDGDVYEHSREFERAPLDAAGRPYAIWSDPAAHARWSSVAEPERGRFESPAGPVDYLAVPFIADDEPIGVFVVASFRDLQQADTDAASFAAGAVGVLMLLIGSILAVWLAERILAPVQAVSRTARTISLSDLGERIAVTGNDEISDLAATFNDMLQRLEDAYAGQRRFLSDAGHELRTPITVIRGHLDVMGNDPEDRRRTLDLVSDELDRIGRIVDDLITLARSERPDFVNPRPVDVDELTMRMLDTARGLATRTWRLDAAAVGRARLDEQRLMQAVLQLASNAVGHTEESDMIAIGSALEEDAVRFWVRDEGPGVSEEDRDRIFERFYRGSAGRRRTEGSGLGLSIVAAIARSHGGVARLEPTDAGATFSLVLPRRDGETSSPEVP